MFILLAILVGGLAACGGVYYATFRAMPWQFHDSDIAFNKEYEGHSNTLYSTRRITYDLTFDSFLELYQINPEKWSFYQDDPRYYGHNSNDYCLFYTTDTETIQVAFSKRDFIKFRKWIYKNICQEATYENSRANSTKNRASAASCQFLLEDVQKDIDKMREEAQKKIDEARELTNAVAARHMVDGIEIVPIIHVEEEDEMIRQEYKPILNPDSKEVKGIYTNGQGKLWTIGDNGEVMYEAMDR